MKAILVIDMPKNCMECPYRLNTNQYRCGVLVNDRRHTPKWTFREDVEKHRYSKCPLKPMPNYIPTPYLFRQMQIADGLQNADGSVPVYSKDYMNGWNECIDEILGENI